MKYKEFQKIIRSLITDSICTFEGIKKFLQTEIRADVKNNDLEKILGAMIQEGELVQINNGAFSAYFFASQVPVRFFLKGSGKVKAIYEGVNTGLPLVSIKSDYTISIKPDEEFIVFPHFTDEEYKKIEYLIANENSYEEIAIALNVDLTKFNSRIKTDPLTKVAISRGRKQKELEEALLNECDLIYRLAITGKNRKKIAEELGYKFNAFTQRLEQFPNLKNSLDLGREEYTKVQERHDSHLIEEKSIEELIEEPKSRKQSNKRVCLCGNPLGARTTECRACWELRQDKSNKTPEKISQIQQQINQILRIRHIERETILKAALEAIFFCPISAVKEDFASKLLIKLSKH